MCVFELIAYNFIVDGYDIPIVIAMTKECLTLTIIIINLKRWHKG